MHASRWPLLKQLEVYKCDEVKIFAMELSIFQEKHEVDPLVSQQSLFIIDKGSFLNLEHLELGAMEIWHCPSPSDFFGQLKSICFRSCSPFFKQASVLFLQRLQNLEKLA